MDFFLKAQPISDASTRRSDKFVLVHTMMLASRCLRVAKPTTLLRSLSTTKPVVPRIVDRNPNETGPGGRGSDAGLKVAVFGASGFLGRYVCCHLGTSVCAWNNEKEGKL